MVLLSAGVEASAHPQYHDQQGDDNN